MNPFSYGTPPADPVRFVERRLANLPERRSGVDHYYLAALEGRRRDLCAAGATIALKPFDVTLTFGGLVGRGRDLGAAMRDWLDAAARARVEGLADRWPAEETVGSSHDDAEEAPSPGPAVPRGESRTRETDDA